MDYRERMINEMNILSIKIDRLNNYITNLPYGSKDITLEFNQLQAMREYKKCLSLRILKTMDRGDNMKKKMYRERYNKSINDFKVLDKVKEPKAEVIEVKPKKKKKSDK